MLVVADGFGPPQVSVGVGVDQQRDLGSPRPSGGFVRLTRVLGDVLSPGVRYAELHTIGDERVGVAETVSDGLFPEERSHLAHAVPGRRREFAEVRTCARRALAELDVQPSPLLPGKGGAPGWPTGIVGSMTHCAGYRAAAVGWDREFVAIGIDAEPNEPLADGVLTLVALPNEIAAMKRLPDDHGVAWDRLLFSAKESVYKAWFPIAHRFLDFHDAEVSLDPAGTLTVRLLVQAPDVHGRPLLRLHGRWTSRWKMLATAVTIPTDPVAAALDV